MPIGDPLLEEEEREALHQLQHPPVRFAERVTAMVVARRKRRTFRTRVFGVGALVLAALVTIALALRTGANRGEAVAGQRLDVRVGSRAAAVLEPGAHISWVDNDVTQSAGEVFYRVELGAAFRVHTKAGDVVVEGTCFVVRVLDGKEPDMKRRDAVVASTAAVLGALTIVGVYEGKVALSHGGGSVHLSAGQSGRADQNGIHGPDDLTPTASSSNDDPLLSANANLADTIRDYKRRLETVDTEKKSLEQRLAVAEHRLAIETDGASALPKSDYDLTQEDWKELARQGRVKLQIPCFTKDISDKDPGPPVVGLSPDDTKLVRDAHMHSNERMWDLVRPLCQQVINNAALVERLGMWTCLQAVMNSMPTSDMSRSIRTVAEMRAGLRQMPGANDPLNPIEKMLLGLTGETRAFEIDLARSLGPDDAHRITYYDDKCMASYGFQ
jgi:hypothetical protein